MKMTLRLALLGFTVLMLVIGSGCTAEPTSSDSANSRQAASPSPSPSPVAQAAKETSPQLTLPVLDALLSNESFVSEVRSKLQLSEDQLKALKETTASEISRLRQSNAEQSTTDTTDARSRAHDQLSAILGDEKTKQLDALSVEFWAKGGDENSGNTGNKSDASMPTAPNSVPTDTRVVVNIPAFRMDLFKAGTLIKSYKIGIGYPEFPLPKGLRKAQTIIFNPTWTPPDSPWVATMKNITPGEKVEAGSSLNPLGPIKIPIGMPSLIHGGKSPAKLGQFASHGCVGLTNAQVKDFAKLLAQASGTEVSDKTMAAYLQDRTRTKVVKLNQTVPVELRYETIVVEDGKLHIYKDVYDEGTNTEENLRAVLAANGSSLEALSAEERSQITEALNAMSAHPKKLSSATQTSQNQNGNTKDRKTARSEKKPVKNQKEVVLEVASLSGKGYPAPVNLDTGTGKPAATVAAR